MALLHGNLGQKVVEGLAARAFLGRAQRRIERPCQRGLFGRQRTARFSQGFALFRKPHFHTRLVDEPGQQARRHRHKTRQKNPQQGFHGVNVIHVGGQ